MIKSALELLVDDLVAQVAELKAYIESTKEKPSRLKRPSLDEIKSEGIKIELPALDCESFYNYYEANGWKVGRNPMKNWKAAMCSWKRNSSQYQRPAQAKERPKTTWELTQQLNAINEEMSHLKSYGGFTDAFGFHWSDEAKRLKFQQLKIARDGLKSKIIET
jgi:hypothetical protein